MGMSLLNASELAFRHPSQAHALFEGVTFQINPGDRVGLIGPNGTGKTTLLRILAGELAPSRGSVVQERGLRIGYVPQESPAPPAERLHDYVLSARDDVRGLRDELRTVEPRADEAVAALRYAGLVAAYAEAGGFLAEAETARVLGGLGFDARERDLPMGRLSSGQRARAELAKLLLTPADLLLMDEPTNHLDIATREWLEEYLSLVPGACLVVSHDRAFLSRAVRRILDLRRGKLTVYEGNYEFYCRERDIIERQAWERYEAQQRRAAADRRSSERRLALARKVATAPKGVRPNKDFYGRKAAKVARTGRILRDRVAREPRAPKPWQEAPIPALDFPNVERASDVVLRAERLAKTYGGKSLFSDISFSVARGERQAILGPNGCGKTTLLRILLGEVPADSGDVAVGARVRIGYYAQEGEDLDPAMSPVELCREVHNDETWARTILGCLKVRGEQAEQPIGTMSAGERGKVVLARLLLSGANLLLLDEPTNHLDLDAREAVEATLAQFPGTILFVTHDEYLVAALADQVIAMGDRRVAWDR
jgi:ATP-binding cassette subfamily F protein 3